MPVPAPVTMATLELEVMSVFILRKCDRSNQDRCRGLRLLSWSLIVAGPAGAVKDRVADFGDRAKDSFAILVRRLPDVPPLDRKSTRLNSSHANISYAVFCLN